MLLERVVRNLGDNAVKYSARGEVRFGALLAGPKVMLWVQDTGIGIAVEEQQKVFEEFYQLGNPERDREQGLGLGLAIVKRLALLMQLPIALESEPGRGTRFTLSLPLAQQALTPAEPDFTPDTVDISGLQILVIDDEENVREGMATLLQSLGCRPLLAADIDSALAIASSARIDVVLTDLRLRGSEDGITAIRRLRERDPCLPALVVTGDTAPQRLRDADEANMVVLHKPVSVDLLMKAIRHQVDSRVQ